MRFHVVSLPHTETTKAYNWCAYTEKVRKFCNMMMARGHEVYLYAGRENEAQCTELITCSDEGSPNDFTVGAAHWRNMNRRAIEGIKERAEPHDFICLIAGLCQKEIASALPDLMSVEFGIGYGGTFAPYRVFESYAWMHMVYGNSNPNIHAVDGNFYDAVIPNYFDVNDFPFSEDKDDYYLYIGRLTDRKGYHLAAEICEKLGRRLIVAGEGEPPAYGEYVGVVDTKKRGELMSRARAVIAPTLYIEPFGGVVVEAMLCGTPVITTDWGAFPETVRHGITGYRCRTFAEFLQAIDNVDSLDPATIRLYAEGCYSLEVIGKEYEAYFKRLLTLYDKGFYT